VAFKRTVEVALGRRNPNAVLKRFAFGSAHKDDAKNEQARSFSEDLSILLGGEA
jgi:hypothetical protein